jgi:hypothetical protein
MIRRLLVFPSLFLAALSLLSCDFQTEPTSPQVTSREILLQDQGTWRGKADLNSMWPNEDQRRWDYDTWAGYCDAPPLVLYENPEDVPPAPPISEVVRLLEGGKHADSLDGIPAGCDETHGIYTLRFDGLKTTLSGAQGQNLVATYDVDPGDYERLLPEAVMTTLLSRLRETRPDLVSSSGLASRDEPPPVVTRTPLFLSGGAWWKSDDAIVLFGDLDQEPSWQFLARDPKPGSGFTFQLVPVLSDDVFLHALILPRSQQRKIHGYQREIEVVYMVDYGVLRVLGPGGDPPDGYLRFVDYGSVVYVPGVGPVFNTERIGASSDDLTRWHSMVTTMLREVIPGEGIAGGFEAAD